MCPEEEHYEEIDMPLIDEEEEIFYQLGWIKETTKQRKEKEKEQEEQKILKEYQDDWAIIENNEYFLILVNEWDKYLEIEKREKRYECYYYSEFTADKNRYSALIDYKTHNLIHKLATLWGWFE